MILTAIHNEEVTGENSRKLRKALDEFDTYVAVNEALIPNYGERWRNEESIATGFVESAVNQIVSKRFAKKQRCSGRRRVPIWCCKCALRCSMNAWKIPFVIGIQTSGENHLKTSSSRRLKHPVFYALQSSPHRAGRRYLYRPAVTRRALPLQPTYSTNYPKHIKSLLAKKSPTGLNKKGAGFDSTAGRR